jgi:competence protein ComEC
VTLCGFVIICLAVWLLFARHRYPRLTPYLLFVFFFAIGGLHATLVLQPSTVPTDISRLAQKSREASLIGVLARAPEIGPERTTLLMEVHEIIDEHSRSEAEGLIQLSMAAPPPADLAPGDLFIARATVGPVLSYGVPGAFNYQEYLAFQGIRASGWIRSPALLLKITRLSSPPWPDTIRFQPEKLRYRLSQFLAKSLPPHTAGIYQAILLGERANLSPKVLEDFQASGSVHLLSISGLHMALVSLCVTLLLSWLLKRSEWVLLHLPATKVAALLSLLPLAAYAMIAGANPPVIRSLIMVAVFIVALLVDRQWSIGNNIAIAALLLLAVNPALLFTASFQLTFTAVAAIALFAPSVAKFIEHHPTKDLSLPVRAWQGLKKWGLASLFISVIASLGTAPILACQFNRVSLVSPLSTLLIEPFLCLWSLMLGLVASLLIGIPPLSHLLFQLGSPGISVSVATADLCARLPWSSVRIPAPGLAVIIAWYGTMLLFAYWRRLSRRQITFGGVALLGILAFNFFPAGESHNKTRLTVLDVGQGSAMIIELPNHEAILIDGGRMQSPTRTGFDVGENLIAPFLWHQKIRRLSAIVCTHPDADHYNGIPFLLRQFKPRTLWINGYDSEEKGYKTMLALAEELGIEIKIPAPGMILSQGKDATLTALTGGQGSKITAAGLPGTEGPETPSPGTNNNESLVLRLKYGQTSFLLPSDIELEAEQALLRAHADLKTDVLVAPHHGSATSSSEGFVAATSPRYVAISAGQNQSGHFPAPETVARYQKLGSTILNTAEKGCLTFRSDGREIRVDTFR